MNNINIIDNTLLDEIAIAVVKQAVDDYRELKRRGVAETEEIYDCKINISIKEVKEFFKSKWAELLTLDNAEYIFNRVQKECEEGWQENKITTKHPQKMWVLFVCQQNNKR